MRVTFGMLTDRVRNNLMFNSEQMLDAQNKASSGKRISKPSDDVTGVSKALSLRSTLSSIEQYGRNANVASSSMSITSSTMDSMVKGLADIRLKALEAMTPAATPESRDTILTAINTIQESLISQANTQHMGKYLFGGSLSSNPPIVVNAGGTPPCTYQGNDQQFNIQVGPGIYLPATVTGDDIFNFDGAALPDQPDFFTSLETLKGLIKEGNVDKISAHLKEFDALRDNVTAIRSQVGARLSRLESTQSSLLDSKTVVKDLLSKTEDVDFAEAVIDLRTKENLYNAALSVAGRLLDTSLADFLR